MEAKLLLFNRILLVLVLIVCLSVICESKHQVLHQAQANCFPGCRCNDTHVECKNLHEGSTELFRYVHPEAYPNLDTLIVTGNDFRVLEDQNIFGGANDRHSKLTLVNLTNNGITSFGAQTFIGIPRVEYLYLSNNQLVSLEDVQPLNYLTSLKVLDMKRAIGNHISANARADLVQRLFRNNHSFIDLQEVVLSGNQLEKLHPDTFCNVKGLTRLYLANNLLTSFNFDTNCLASLHLLDLSGNRIHSVAPSLWKALPSLDSTDISSNPLQCDCALEDFHKFALEEVNNFLNQEATTCALPKKLAGQKIFEMDTNLCRFGNRFWHWFLLIFLGAGIIAVYYRYGRGIRPNWLMEKWDRARNSQMRVPLVDNATGYSQLKDDLERFDNDRNVPPAFV